MEARYLIDIDRLEPGDILVSRIRMNLEDNSTWDSHLIQTYTRSPFSHAALYVGNGLCIEGVGSGVARLPLARAGIADADSVRVLRVRGPGTDLRLSVGRKAAACGLRYLQRGFCSAQPPRTKGSAFHDVHRAAVVSSGIVATAYAEANFSLVDKQPYATFPGDFLDNVHTEDITAAVLTPLTPPLQCAFLLDGSSLGERVQHWEVATQLKVLCNFNVRRILDIHASKPASMRELETLLATKRWSALDEALVRNLKWYRYAAVYQQKLHQFFGRVSAEPTAIERALPTVLGETQLNAAAAAANIELRQLESEREHWQQQVDFYKNLAALFPSATFTYFLDLYSKVLAASDQWLQSKQQQQRAYGEEAQRRGLHLKSA